MNKEGILLSKARNRLFIVWIIGSIVPTVIIMIQTILGSKYEGIAQQVWGWFSPLIFPTITLMIGVIGASAFNRDNDTDKTVDPTFFNITIGLSVFYFLAIDTVILAEPFSDKGNPLSSFTTSNLFLTPVQALTTAALGFLFTSVKKSPREQQASDNT